VVTEVAHSFDKPNGICFSPGERTLYVADNGEPHHLKAFDVWTAGDSTESV
jgi:sugar lactone lactonase YvrE